MQIVYKTIEVPVYDVQAKEQSVPQQFHGEWMPCVEDGERDESGIFDGHGNQEDAENKTQSSETRVVEARSGIKRRIGLSGTLEGAQQTQ